MLSSLAHLQAHKTNLDRVRGECEHGAYMPLIEPRFIAYYEVADMILHGTSEMI